MTLLGRCDVSQQNHSIIDNVSVCITKSGQYRAWESIEKLVDQSWIYAQVGLPKDYEFVDVFSARMQQLSEIAFSRSICHVVCYDRHASRFVA